MADDEIIAAILTAGMLPVHPIPQSTPGGPVTEAEQEEMIRAVGHAVGLYRAVLVALRNTRIATAGAPKARNRRRV